MILDFKLPLISPHMSDARVECVFVAPGDTLKTGSKLFDLRIDLGNDFSQECPPISYFRIIIREAVQVTELMVKPGDSCAVGSVLALFSAGDQVATERVAARGVRYASAGILHHAGMWTGNHS